MREGEAEAEWRARHYDIEVHFLNTETGERALYKDTGWDEDESPAAFEAFMWSDGNYACDCNRDLFFCRALGRPEPWDRQCGDGQFVIEKIVRVSDGAVAYTELP